MTKQSTINPPSPIACGSAAPPIVTFTTDFNSQDWFVGVMEGVIAAICPSARVIAITHGIPPQDIRAGAFALAAAVPFYPAGTTHVAIVDPGVGSDRKPIVVRTPQSIFIGPDNGLLSWALRNEREFEVREIQNERLFLKNVSASFHGRDIFAPAAAHLASGFSFAEVGPRLETLVRLDWPVPHESGDAIEGEIIYTDAFGNCISNIPDNPHTRSKKRVRVRELGMPVVTSYSAVRPGAAGALFASHGFLEIAVNQGSAASDLHLKAGDRFFLA